MASQWFVIARREFVERVRTKWFVIVTVLGPLFMTGMIVVPALLAARSADKEVKVAVVDHSGRRMVDSLQQTATVLGSKIQFADAGAATDAELVARIGRAEIAGYLTLPADTLTGGQVSYRGDNAANLQFLVRLGGVLTPTAYALRAADAGIPRERLIAMLAPVPLDAIQLTGKGAPKAAAASSIIGYVAMFLLYMSILLYAVNVMRSVVQEKTSRVVEVLLGVAKPEALMLGKVLGVGAVGLLQLGVWGGMGLLLIHMRGALLGLFGIHGSGMSLPPIAGGDFALLLVYFVLGYFLYAALYAAIGAMVNSEQEAQQVQTPVVMLLVIPMLCVQLVADDPRGTVAQVLTLVPLSSPVVMPTRWLLDGASAGEVALSLAILVASVAGVVWFAARIYRVGILMYGKRPSLRELGRWLRH